MADNADDLRLKNGRWFASLARPLNPQERQALLEALQKQDYQEFINVCVRNNILNPQSAFIAGLDWQDLGAEGIKIPLGEPLPAEPKQAPSGTGVGTAAVGIGLAALSRPEKYEDFKKRATNYAEGVAQQWEKEEEKILKKPPKTPDPNRPASRQEAYGRAEKYYHDLLAGGNTKQAKKWLSENPGDIHLAQAVDRHELQRRNLTYEEFQSIRQRYLERTPDPQAKELADREMNDLMLLHSHDRAREWAKKYNDPALGAAVERKRLLDEESINRSRIRRTYHNSRLGKQISRTRDKFKESRTGRGLSRVNKSFWAAVGLPSAVANRLSQTGAGRLISRAKDRFSSALGTPGRAINKVKNRLANTRLGRFAARANRARKKISNLLNPATYLQWLFKRATQGALGGAVGGVASAALSFVSGIVTTVGAAATAALGFLAAKIPFIIGKISALIGTILGLIGSLPISGPALGVIVALSVVIILFASIAGVFFPPPDAGQFPEESPYPGIAYSIACPPEAPESIPSGSNIRCDIIFIHDSSLSSVSLDDLTLVSDFPSGTELVEAQTTGNYILDPEGGIISWALSENSSFATRNETQTSYNFTYVLNPLRDITADITLSIEGLSDDSGRGDPAVGDDCTGQYTQQNSPQGNFGDPECDFTKNGLKDELDRIDRPNAEFWYLIAECESGHRPNAYFRCNADRTICTPQVTGAWGLFQMSISRPNRAPYYAGGRGPWEDQTRGAVNRNKKVINESFDYWACEEIVCRDNRSMCTSNDQYISRN
ncbi:MAG: hypothetical protein HYW63_01935 [Candidatus Levybacteria bacterium]|nr:hypothetical protein [Candidatus Levybacteria bacterium]